MHKLAELKYKFFNLSHKIWDALQFGKWCSCEVFFMYAACLDLLKQRRMQKQETICSFCQAQSGLKFQFTLDLFASPTKPETLAFFKNESYEKIYSKIKNFTFFFSIKSPKLNYFSLPSPLSLFFFSIWKKERNQKKIMTELDRDLFASLPCVCFILKVYK